MVGRPLNILLSIKKVWVYTFKNCIVDNNNNFRDIIIVNISEINIFKNNITQILITIFTFILYIKP